MNVLEHGKVHSLCRRAVDDSTPRVSNGVCLARAAGWISLETSGIEVLLESVGRVCVGVADYVGSVSGNECRNVTKSRRVKTSRWGKRQSGLQGYDTGSLPAAQDVPSKIVMLAEERQLIDVVRSEDVSAIERRPAAIQPVVIGILRSIAAVVLIIREIL